MNQYGSIIRFKSLFPLITKESVSDSLSVGAQVHGLSVGAVRRGVPRHLHRQPGRLHDHPGGVGPVLWAGWCQGDRETREIMCKIPWIFQLSNPQSMKPALKFGTVPWTYSDNALRKHFPNMHLHMKQYNEQNVVDGVNAVKRGWAWMINMSFIVKILQATNGKICKILREYDDVERSFCIKLQKSISDMLICKIN